MQNFIPQSKYYGDKYPRTMEEAFGPYSELDVDRQTVLSKAMPILIVCAAILVFMLWLTWALAKH